MTSLGSLSLYCRPKNHSQVEHCASIFFPSAMKNIKKTDMHFCPQEESVFVL